MENIVGLKELRQNMASYAGQVRNGKTFIVVKRSKPLFKISSVEDEGVWEAVADFTKIRKGGMELKKILARL